MFQYAAARALAEYRKVPLYLDVSHLKKDTEGKYTPRSFELDCFNINAKIATSSELIHFKESSRLKRVLQRMGPSLLSGITFYESGQTFYEKFFKLSGDTRLVGFWQSEKYFLNYRQLIETDFSLKNEVPENRRDLLAKIKSVNSVSLHVRRGDYVTLASAGNFHGTCGIDYYQRAMEVISKRAKDLHVFVFSDDIDWCRDNLKLEQPIEFVEPGQSCVDMFLMSSCRHNIIANSSFSWWAAWLNKNPHKTVIAPGKWFKDESANSKDLIPASWTKI